jgi:signal transduction histidine kinase
LRSWPILLLAGVLSAFSAVRAQAQPVVHVRDRLNGEDLARRVSVLEDASGDLTFAQVREPQRAAAFRVPEHPSLGYGFTRSAYWVRIVVINTADTERPWLLELPYPHLDHVTLFHQDAQGAVHERRTGDLLPFAERDVEYRTFVFSLSEPPRSTRTYYLRVQTGGSLNIPLVAWTTLPFLVHQARELSGLWLFYGILLAMAVYNAFLFTFLRQLEYLHYVMYNASLLLFQFSMSGHMFQYLLPNQMWLANHSLPFWIAMTLVWTTLFLKSYLRLDVHFPRVNRALSWACALWVVLAIYGLFGSYAVSIRLLVASVLVSTCLSPLILIPLARQGMRQARLYIAAWGAFLTGVFVFALKSVGVLPSSLLTEWGIQIGAATEVVLLSVALADRINAMRANLGELNAQLSQHVTDLKTALHQAQAGTRAKLDFLATVSHELRTPLNAIINIPGGLMRDFEQLEGVACTQCDALFALEAGEQLTADALCPDCGAQGALIWERGVRYRGDPQASLRHLRHIERSGKHLLQMVNGILDFSKAEAGKLSLNLEDIDVEALLEDALAPLAELALNAGVQLHYAAAEPSIGLRADAVKVKQVLINLVSNAIKFSDGRGRVSVRAERSGKDCVFHVEDEGIGIAPADLERVFQSFEQVHSGETRKYAGTGLGLSICKALVDLHAGHIWVESELGKGSVFSFRIPRVPPSKQQPKAPLHGYEGGSAPNSLPGFAFERKSAP